MTRRWLLFALLVVATASLGVPAQGAARPAAHPLERSQGCAVGSNSQPSSRLEHLTAGGISGTYLLGVPRRHDRAHPAHLVLAFYGFASDPIAFAHLTGLLTRGPQEGDVVAIIHDQPGELEFQLGRTSTDFAFVSSVIRSVEHKECVLTHQLAAVGFSDGAAFSILYACAHQGAFSQLATVAVEFQLGCTRPISVLAFHGTADPAVPYQNGAIGSSLPGLKVRGTQENMSDWAHLDGCRRGAKAHRLSPHVVEQHWDRCTRGTSVRLFTVLGGGHSWPGGGPQAGGGLVTRGVDASQLILRFISGSSLGP